MAIKREFSVLEEEISKDNVQSMAELLTLIETRWLIGKAGQLAISVNSKLYIDLLHKDEVGYILSDSYDIVQSVALFLCEHFGERLYDYCTSKNGKTATLKSSCYRIVNRMFGAKCRRLRKDIRLECLATKSEPRVEITGERKDYTAFDTILSKLGLNDYYSTILNCRMAGMSFPEIGRIVGRQISTVWEALDRIRRKYIEVTQ